MRLTILYLLTVLVFSTLFVDISMASGNKAPAKVEKSRCAGAETAPRRITLRKEFTLVEKRKLYKLRETLKADGVDPSIIKKIFNSPGFGLYDRSKKLFKSNPEKKADSGGKGYDWYRDCLEIDMRVTLSGKFRRKYKTALAGAEKKYGVDRRYIASIIGVESSYATLRGRFNAVNALATQYVLVKNRKKYAARQLRELIKYSRRTNTPLADFTSSYAGAIGYGQFIPSSLNGYFVGKAGKVEKADPFDVTDCIYSVAYYLKRSGWRKSENHITPTKGSKNWKAIRAYNHSDVYTRLVIEMATRMK